MSFGTSIQSDYSEFIDGHLLIEIHDERTTTKLWWDFDEARKFAEAVIRYLDSLEE